MLVLGIMLSTTMFAKAGSSFSSHSSSSSFGTSHPSYSSPSSSSSSYHPSSSYTPRPSYSAYPAPVSHPSYTAPKQVTINKTTIIHHDSGSSGYGGNSGSGMGIGGTMLGVAGGVVAGNAITAALSNHNQQQGVPQNTQSENGQSSTAQQQPMNNVPAATANNGTDTNNGSYMNPNSQGVQSTPNTPSTPNSQSTPASVEKEFSFLNIMEWIAAFIGLLVIVAIYKSLSIKTKPRSN